MSEMHTHSFILFFLIFVFLKEESSQFQQCSFLGGSKDINTPSIWNEKGKTIPNWIGGRTGSTSFPMKTKGDRHSIMIFFGMISSSPARYTDEAWEFFIETNQWIFKKGRNTTSQGPTNEEIGSRVFVKGWKTTEMENTFLFFFGGTAYVECRRCSNTEVIRSTYTNELWMYNVTNNSYLPLHQIYFLEDNHFENILIGPGNNHPSGRSFHEIIQIGKTHSLLVGGLGILTSEITIGALGDWWIFSSESMKWEFKGGHLSSLDNNCNYGTINTYETGNQFGAMYDHVGFLANDEEVLIFGGTLFHSSSRSIKNVVQKYNISSNMWKYVSGDLTTLRSPEGYLREFSTFNVIGARIGHKIWKLNDNEALLFGGSGPDFFHDGSGYLHDEWRYNLNTNLWKYSGKDASKYKNRYQTIVDEKYSIYTLPGGLEYFVGEFFADLNSLYIFNGKGISFHSKEGVLNNAYKFYLGNMCGSFEESSPNVCSGHGICQNHDTCACDEGYTGKECELTYCGNYLSNDSMHVCSNNGFCIDRKCYCFSTSFYINSDDCSVNAIVQNLWIAIVTPLAAIIVCCIIVVIVVIFVLLLLKSQKRFKKFDQIEDIELILEEQKVSKDALVPKFKIKKKMFEINHKDIKIIEKIGEGGGLAVCFSGYWNNQLIAYKCFSIANFLGEKKFQEFEKEVEILASISFPFILTFYGVTLDENRLGIVMEYAKNGDLEHFLKKKNNYPLKEKLRMLYQISSAMLYLHNKKIIHRDLKPQNILVTSNEEIKLMDFGLSKFLDYGENDKTMTKRVGSSIFMAPEVLSGKYSYPCDVYSFSILMLVIFSENFGMQNKYKKFKPDIKIVDELKLPNRILEMMKQNWSPDPSKRMNFKTIVGILKNFKGLDFQRSNETKMQINRKNFETLQKNNKILNRKVFALEKTIRRLKEKM